MSSWKSFSLAFVADTIAKKKKAVWDNSHLLRTFLVQELDNPYSICADWLTQYWLGSRQTCWACFGTVSRNTPCWAWMQFVSLYIFYQYTLSKLPQLSPPNHLHPKLYISP